ARREPSFAPPPSRRPTNGRRSRRTTCCTEACYAVSPGPSMPRGDDWPGRPAPVLVFDLDGTVLRVNSFPHWVLFLFFGPIRGIGAPRRLRLAFRAARLLLLRKLHRIDHDTLLAGLQRAWWEIPSSVTGALVDPLQTMLLRHVRPNLRPLL